MRRLADLAPNESNPRRITPERRAKLRRSLEELGNLSPVTFNVRTGRILGGHKRVEILLEMGEERTAVWCVDLPAGKENPAMLALNTHAGEWDEDKLSAMLKGLSGSEMDAEFFDLAHALEQEPVEIRKVEIKPPPKFAWCLVGVPIVEFGKVQALLDRLPSNAIIKTTQNDGPANNQNGQPQPASQGAAAPASAAAS